MIHREAWYKEALEKEYQRILRSLPEDLRDPQGQEAFEQLKKLYLRIGKLPPDVGEKLYDWVLERAQRGEYYPDDLKILWGGSTAFPDVPLKVVLDTPPEYLPKVKVKYESTTLHVRRLREEGDPPYTDPPYVSLYDREEAREEGVLTEADLAPSEYKTTYPVDGEMPLSEYLLLVRNSMGGEWDRWIRPYDRGFNPYVTLYRSKKGFPLAVEEETEGFLINFLKENPPPVDITSENLSVTRVYDPPLSDIDHILELMGSPARPREVARSFTIMTLVWLREMGAI